jgi:transcriptional regulator with XRE-family HTH domain
MPMLVVLYLLVWLGAGAFTRRTAAPVVGLAIRNLREQRGLSRTELAAAVGLSAQSIELYELGRRTPKLDQLVVIANVLEVPLTELVREVA